jgi:hypothetical protein
MTTLTGTVKDGDTLQYEFRVEDGLELVLNANRQPYDIDIETKQAGLPDSDYSRIQPLQDFSQVTVEDTSEHTYKTGEVEQDVRITITNNSGQKFRVSGRASSIDATKYFVEDGRKWVYSKKQDSEDPPDISGVRSILLSTGNIVDSRGNQYSWGSGSQYSDFGEAANDALTADNAETVYAPPTTDEYSTTIEIGINSRLIGSGRYDTIPKYTGPDEAVKTVAADESRIQNIGFLGDGTTDQIGIRCDFSPGDATTGLKIENVALATFDGHAIKEDGGNAWQIEYENVDVADINGNAYESLSPVPQRTVKRLRSVYQGKFTRASPDHNLQYSGDINGDFVKDDGTDWLVTYEECYPEAAVQGRGFYIIDSNDVAIRSTNAENVGDDGYELDNIGRATLIDAKASSVGESSYELFTSGITNFINCRSDSPSSGNDLRVRGGRDEHDKINVIGGSIDDINQADIVDVHTNRGKYGATHPLIDSNTTLDDGTSVALVNTNQGTFTITLPSAAVHPGNKITIKDKAGNASSNNITVDTEGSESIDGSSTLTINTDRGYVTVTADFDGWFVVGRN